jgi:hypothetical protein
MPHGNKKFIKKFIIYILNIKSQLLDASFMVIIWFNFIKFDNHDDMIL